MTQRIAILAQYDPDNGIPSHVRLHLQGLRPVVDRLILVSNSPIDSEANRFAEGICDRVLVRQNSGWDFGGWRDVIVTEDLTRFDRVILTNSSVIGPLFPLGPIFEKMESRDPDLWGMVLSKNKGLHLQSYFLSASAKVVASDAWQSFWNSVEDFDDKNEVIRQYEIGFSQAMSSAGFQIVPMMPSATFPQNLRLVNVVRLQGRLKVPFNINYINRTVEFHEDLIKRGMPYLKASLLYGKDKHRFVGTDRIRSINGVDFPFDDLKS